MNAARLNELLAKPAEMSAEDLHALENLCRDFPAFGLPYFLLARAYHDRNDYRYRETLHAAALRCPNRLWLREFMEGARQKTQGDLLVDHGDEKPAATEGLQNSETDAVAVVSDPESNESVEVLETSTQESSISSVEQPLQNTPAEPNDALPQLHEVSDALVSEEESADVKEQPVLRETIEVELIDTGIKPKVEVPPSDATAEIKPWRRKHVDPAAMTVYSIEDHYPPAEQPEEHGGVRDFFSWLRNPHKEMEDSIPPPEPKEEKDDIIRRFLETRPSVSRPKKEFFNPVNMAKKSEQEDPELVTETLANIYWKQGNRDKAIGMFEKLILKYPGKRPYFAALIQKIRQENES